MKFRFVLIISLFLNLLIAQENITTISPKSEFDASHKYFYELLEKSLNYNPSKINISFFKKMGQGRALIELKKNRSIDVYWAGTSIKREEELRAIKIPLVKGLLGYRVFIINKDSKNNFDKIKTIEELKKLKPCQGRYWPDTEILEKSGFNVVKNTKYEAMFLQLSIGRCDYFPRGINEANSEMEARKEAYPTLMIYNKIILYYPFPVYFFVSKENEELALKIENGLLKMIEDGSFDKYLKQSPITKHLFPISKWQNNTTFKIPNHLLSPNTNIRDTKFWITPMENTQ